MAIKLNHTIINVRDKKKSAKFFTELFGLPKAKPFSFIGKVITVQRIKRTAERMRSIR